MTARIRGLVPVCLTTFQEDGTLDLDAYRRLLEFYMRAGAGGLFVNCLSSEMYHLAVDERLTLAREAVRAARGRIPVASGAFQDRDHGATGEIIEQIQSTGAEIAVLLTCHLADREQPEEAASRSFWRLVDSIPPGVKLGLYECPSPYRRAVELPLLSDAAHSGRLSYLKDTSISLDTVQSRQRAIDGTECGIFNAYTPDALASLRSGIAGVSPISANFFPEAFAWLCANPGHPEADWLQAELAAADAQVHAGGYPQTAKRFLQLRGLPIGVQCRSMSGGITPEREQVCRDLLDRFHSWRERLDF